MQEMTTDICNNQVIWATGSLIDWRDGETYNITKLDDGNCWMTQNLRLVDKTITKTDSDVTSDFTVPKSVTSVSSSTWGSDNTMQKAYYANNTTNGAYYTWCAATAGSCSSATTANAIAGSSICPKGWRLPTEAEYRNLLSKAGIGDNSAGSTKIQGSPYNFVVAGDIYSSKLQGVGSSGRYWSSTASNSTGAYILEFGSSFIYTNNNSRSDGRSIRCIAK